MKALEVLEAGQRVATTVVPKGLVVLWDGSSVYTIYRVEGEEWTRLESFSDGSEEYDPTGAILEWLFSQGEL